MYRISQILYMSLPSCIEYRKFYTCLCWESAEFCKFDFNKILKASMGGQAIDRRERPAESIDQAVDRSGSEG